LVPPYSDRRSGPFAHAVKRKYCRLFEWRWIEGGCRVSHVMLGEQHLAKLSGAPNLPFHILLHPSLAAEDRLRSLQKLMACDWTGMHAVLDDPVPRIEGLVIEDDRVNVLCLDSL